ncbi:uncharacterized protein Dvir_GJ17124, isoform C [Drosophila virilis]|uniref:tRNA (34-2'-O)-methyltransferase regulator WDR6 n=1 Tax=Drosophila virilis TaxID=7244 RepID=A0A0Q9WSN6_DROVI|nr:WD repeat-containing protein 6 isoform X2 [Drosophila virilis]KRF85271.1 uncharacterized protein Dvir_GJ17124, isoform C [Drosophila virilis]
MKPKNILFTDALALNISQHSLFTAIGNQALFLSSNSNIRLPQEVRYKKVHGFAFSHKCEQTGLLLFYAENEFSLFKYDTNQKETFVLIYEGETKDWINAAVFLKDEGSGQFVLHMAHGALLRLQYNNPNNIEFGECSILELARCTDYSLLYYTILNGTCYNKLNIISGNAFGEILIWQPHTPVHINLNSRSKIFRLCLRLKAHNGVIFSIDIHLAARLLVTTSDDRSLKFWQLESGSAPDIKLDTALIKPLFSCFGHTARVICATIAEYGGQIFVISGGEDSHICIWSHSGELLFKRRQQFGAPIWRLSFDHSTSTLYSTGSTGNVLAYNLKMTLSPKHIHSTQLISLDSSTEFMKKIKYLNNSTIIALSNKNNMFYMRLTKSSEKTIWKSVADFPTYKCTVLAINDGIIATCGYQRVTLLSYNENTERFKLLYDGVKLNGLIQSFHFLSKELYLISDEYGNCLLLKGNNMDVEGSIIINKCREPWITAALLVSLDCLLLSTRNGHLMLYAREGCANLQLKTTLKRLHGKMGSTLLQLLKIDEKIAYILSAGHESALRLLRLNLTDYRLTFLQRQCVPLAWVEASPTIDLLIGFNNNHIVAWSNKNDVVLQLQCGGGHRCWDYQLNNEELDIIYIKQNHVFHYRELLYNKWSSCLWQTLRNEWHIRSCNIIQLIEENNVQPYIVSAGDDNIIKINQVIGQSFYQCAELHTHISSIRHLVLCPIKCENVVNYWLIFSVGGRAQLCINKFDTNGPVVSEVCSHIHTAPGEFSLYIASADGKIRLLHWQQERPTKINVHCLIDIKRCPLQMRSLNNLNLLLITTTNGMLYGFDKTLCLKRFELKLHASGINAFDTLDDCSRLHILSGGDDEIFKYTTIQKSDMSVLQSTQFSAMHNAQINALGIHSLKQVDEASQLRAYTCSMDKQIYMVNLKTLKYTRIGYTCLSDIKGILIDKNQRLYIYGCGLEVILLENN